MATRILSAKDVESISIADMAKAEMLITNTGLSDELKQELSKDVSNDSFIMLVRMKLNDVWYNFSNDPTELSGVDERGRPIYKTVWNGEDWAYMPFEIMLNSIKASGEIVGSSFQVPNYDKEIALAFENMREAIPIKLYVISKKTSELVVSDEHKYITTATNTGIVIQGETNPADVLSGACPCQTYDKRTFR